jgi:hypothetical protein
MQKIMPARQLHPSGRVARRRIAGVSEELPNAGYFSSATCFDTLYFEECIAKT